MLPLISVIVPIYKVESYLRECVDSLINQTYKNLEIILVDDGSPDNCPDICDRYTESDSRITVVHKSNGGLSDARNAGMKQANGEYISFIDSDDFVSTDMLEKLYTAINDNGADIAECNVTAYRDGETSVYYFEPEAVYNTNKALMKAYIKDFAIKTVVWNKLYRKELINDIKFEKGRLNEDEFFTYKALAKAEVLVHIDESCYFYRQRSGSIMDDSFSLKRLDAVYGMAERARFIRDNYSDLYVYELEKMTAAIVSSYTEILRHKELDKNKAERKKLKMLKNEFVWSVESLKQVEKKSKLRAAIYTVSLELCARMNLLK